jgi:hypothetical protein
MNSCGGGCSPCAHLDERRTAEAAAPGRNHPAGQTLAKGDDGARTRNSCGQAAEMAGDEKVADGEGWELARARRWLNMVREVVHGPRCGGGASGFVNGVWSREMKTPANRLGLVGLSCHALDEPTAGQKEVSVEVRDEKRSASKGYTG